MLKIQMLEQIMTNDESDEECENSAFSDSDNRKIRDKRKFSRQNEVQAIHQPVQSNGTFMESP
jgi:hypothetical protein